jgi:hypothetical protein
MDLRFASAHGYLAVDEEPPDGSVRPTVENASLGRRGPPVGSNEVEPVFVVEHALGKRHSERDRLTTPFEGVGRASLEDDSHSGCKTVLQDGGCR